MSQSQIGSSLRQLNVDVEDTSTLSSAYFLLSNFNPSFGLGKNAVTINSPTKDIRVEACDSEGNVLYSERAIDNDTVNKKQILTVSFHVYSKTSAGIGKLYIVGTVANKLVRYSMNITINTTVLNTSKVAFYTTPTIEVTPLLTFVAKTNLDDANPKIITGSFFAKAGYPIVNFNVDDNRYNKLYTDYQLTTIDSNFSSSFSNFYAKLYVEKIRSPVTGQEQIVSDTSSILIKNVINAKTLQLDSPYIYKNPANNKNTVTEIIQGRYEILYSEYEYNPLYFTTASYLTESVDFSGNTRYKKNSIAEITYKNIDTFSGTVVRHKLYRRSLNVPEDYTTIVDESFAQNEYLKNSIVPVKSYQNLGNFYSQDFINKFWLTSSNSFNLIANSDYYINGVNITGSSITDGYIITKLDTSDTYRNSTYISYNENEYLNQSGSSYDCNFIKLLGKTNYILSFNCNLLKKNINDMMELSFYLIGSYENNKKEVIYNQEYGVLLANIQVKDLIVSKNFKNTLKFKFTPLNDIYGTLVIVPRGFDSVILNNISLQQDKVDGYSYNSYTIRVPFRVDQPNELYDIKAELYDAGSNIVYSNLRTIQSFDPSGSSSPVNNFNTTTLSVGVLNVSSETNITGSINVDNFGCAPETNINNVNYLVTWDSINKNLCVATSSLFISSSGGGGGTSLTTGSTYPITASWARTSSVAITALTASSLANGNYNITSSWSTNSLTASSLIAGNSYTITNLTASNISSSTITSSVALIDGNLTVNGSIFASVFSASVIYITSSEVIVGDNIITLNALTPYKRYAGIEVYDSGSGTISSFLLDGQNDYFFITSSNINGKVITGPDGQLNLTTNKIPKAISGSSLIDSNISDNGTTVNINNNIYASQNSITQSVAGVQVSTLVTQSIITLQNGSSSFVLNGRLSSSNINVGIPNSNYPWGTSPLTGSYFSTWNSDTNVSDVLRFFAGAFSSSYPIPSPNTKTFSGVTGTNTNFGSTVTITGRVPSGSTNANILYLQPLGWATIGSTIFSGSTFNTGAAYISYASTVGGSTTVSSSLGANAFGLGLLTSGNLTQVNLSGSFRLTFASSSTGTINYTNNSASVIISQSVTNLTPSITTPIALNTVPSANTAVIPPVYQDGYFSNFTGSNLTNSISLSNISSSGIYVFSASIGINSGSSAYTSYSPSSVTYYYTPLTDASFTQSITSPNSSASYVSAVTRSLSGAPYLTSGSRYRYVVTSSGAFNPLYVNGTVASVTFTNATLGLTTTNSSSLTTNPTIQTAGVVKSSDYVTTRTVGTHPFESDVIVFDLTLNTAGTGSNAASSGSSFSTFTVSTTTNNRAGSATVVGSQIYNIHITGSFGIPAASGSLLYFGRPNGYVTSSLTFGSQSLNPGAITEQLLDEGNRIILADNMLNMSGSAFNSSSVLGTSELQVKPGFLANPGGSNGYWYPSGYGTTYKYYVRRFKSNLVVNKLQITLTGNTSLVNWDSTSSNTVAMAILFESANSNVYPRCRLYDVNNLSNNVISSSVTPSDFTTSGVNPFGSNIDLYGNNGTGASNTSGIFIFPTRAADGAILDNTNTAQDELYLLIRYNGSPTPITSIKIEKLS